MHMFGLSSAVLCIAASLALADDFVIDPNIQSAPVVPPSASEADARKTSTPDPDVQRELLALNLSEEAKDALKSVIATMRIIQADYIEKCKALEIKPGAVSDQSQKVAHTRRMNEIESEFLSQRERAFREVVRFLDFTERQVLFSLLFSSQRELTSISEALSTNLLESNASVPMNPQEFDRLLKRYPESADEIHNKPEAVKPSTE